jgi:elongation factor Ts
MAVTSEQVKLLREKTGAGMMDCKRALEESGGDFEKAIEYLRKKGAATAQKRADKMAKEGAIVTRISPDGKVGVVVEVNCETDFVARGEDFINFVTAVAEAVERHKPLTVDQVMTLSSSAGKSISELLNELLAKVGEKIEIRRFAVYETQKGMVGGYTHMGSKIGVLVELDGKGSNDGAIVSRDVAMQIAAMNPQYIKRDEVTKDIIAREMEIYRTQARNEKKAEQVIDRIAAGRLEKFFQEVCLLEQTFIKDPAKTVKDILGDKFTVRRFQRYHLGEN